MWNERYRSTRYAYGKAPNEFFRSALHEYKPSGKALFPAEGEGRNAVYAAKQGLDAVAFDISQEGKNKALQLAAEEGVSIEYRVGDFLFLDFTEESFDCAVLVFAHFPPPLLAEYHKKIASLVKPGGWLIFEGFSKNHLPYRAKNPSVGGPNKAEMLFSKEGIAADFSAFKMLSLQECEVQLNEGEFHKGLGKVIRGIGQKLG